MINKQHAVILAIIGTALTALFFVFFSKPEDPKGQGGNYPLPGAVTSPIPTLNPNRKARILVEGEIIPGVKPQLMTTTEIGNDLKRYTFTKATNTDPAYKNFSVDLPPNWNAYEIGPSIETNLSPVSGKYLIVLENTASEYIMIHQFASSYLDCTSDPEFSGDNLNCETTTKNPVTSQFGSSYIIGEDGIFRFCIDMTERPKNTLMDSISKDNLECFYGTSIGRISIQSNKDDQVSSEVLEIIESITPIE